MTSTRSSMRQRTTRQSPARYKTVTLRCPMNPERMSSVWNWRLMWRSVSQIWSGTSIPPQVAAFAERRQVNETLSIGWELARPRVLWDGGMQIGGSSCVSCGQCVTVCPCNALMEKSMLGEAGYMTSLPKDALEKMIDVVKAIEPEMGYGAIMKVSETEAHMREPRIKKTK